MYCNYCGRKMKKTIVDERFDMYDGKKIQRFEYKCPDYREFFSKHTKITLPDDIDWYDQ